MSTIVFMNFELKLAFMSFPGVESEGNQEEYLTDRIDYIQNLLLTRLITDDKERE